MARKKIEPTQELSIPESTQELKKEIEKSDIVVALNQIAEILLMTQKHTNIMATIMTCQHTPKLKPGLKLCGTCRVGLEAVPELEQAGEKK